MLFPEWFRVQIWAILKDETHRHKFANWNLLTDFFSTRTNCSGEQARRMRSKNCVGRSPIDSRPGESDASAPMSTLPLDQLTLNVLNHAPNTQFHQRRNHCSTHWSQGVSFVCNSLCLRCGHEVGKEEDGHRRYSAN